jgi:chromosome segregation ATPase
MANTVTTADGAAHEPWTGTDVDDTGTDEQYRGEMNRLTQMLVSCRQSQEERMLAAKTVRDSKKLEVDALAESINARREELVAQIHEIEAEKADINKEIGQLRATDLAAKKAPLNAELKSLGDKLSHLHDDYDDACRIYMTITTTHVASSGILSLSI